MPSSGSPLASTRYIVRAAHGNDALAGFIDSIRDNPAIHLVDTIPASGPPHTLVVEADTATVEQLRQHYLNQLLFEPDRPLSLFD